MAPILKLYYLVVSYAEKLRFCKKEIFDRATNRKNTIIRLSLRLSGINFDT
jgi:hypothetical protein